MLEVRMGLERFQALSPFCMLLGRQMHVCVLAYTLTWGGEVWAPPEGGERPGPPGLYPTLLPCTVELHRNLVYNLALMPEDRIFVLWHL